MEWKSSGTTIVSSTQAQATILSTDLVLPGTAQVAVLDASTGLVSNNVTFTIVQPSFAITTSALPSGITGTGYSTTLTATGGVAPYSWSVASGVLPPGLELATNGTISGTPTTSGQYTFTAAVSDSSSPALMTSKTLSISISPAPTVNCRESVFCIPADRRHAAVHRNRVWHDQHERNLVVDRSGRALSASGLYTAPTTVSSTGGSVIVKATSVADPTKD